MTRSGGLGPSFVPRRSPLAAPALIPWGATGVTGLGVAGVARAVVSSSSTSYVERGNLSIRTCLKRFGRLTLSYSKGLRSLEAAVSLYVGYYSFVRVHETLRVTPAMEPTARTYDGGGAGRQGRPRGTRRRSW